jgi:hypothetical protein
MLAADVIVGFLGGGGYAGPLAGAIRCNEQQRIRPVAGPPGLGNDKIRREGSTFISRS